MSTYRSRFSRYIFDDNCIIMQFSHPADSPPPALQPTGYGLGECWVTRGRIKLFTKALLNAAKVRHHSDLTGRAVDLVMNELGEVTVLAFPDTKLFVVVGDYIHP